MRRPSNEMLPADGAWRPDTVRSVVVLPAPLAPMSVTTAAAGTEKVMPLTARILP
jgi:hypothetical protein